MSFYSALMAYMESEISSLRRQKTLFYNHMPTDCHFGALLKDGYAAFEIDGDTKHRKGKFQVVVRGRNFKEADTLIRQVMEVLEFQQELELDDGVLVRSIRVLTEPLAYPPSAGGYTEMSVNLYAIYGIVKE